LKEVNFKLNLGKCEFAKTNLTFIGHVVNHDGRHPNPQKIKVVIDFPTPTSTINVRTFLGLTCYYQNYVKSYSRIAMPFFDLTKKDVVFKWNHNYQDAFNLLKTTFVSTPILIRPNFSRTFILDVDWSIQKVGTILSSKEGKIERVIANKVLSHVQKKFHPMEGECYAPV
jgi:hypothetical protein